MQFHDLIHSDTPVLFDFYANWCKPCLQMMPLVDELQAAWGDRVRVVKVDVDQHLDLAVDLKIMGVPTFLFYHNGKELWRRPGTMTKGELREAVETELS